jgi:hypothetical protein
MLGDRSSCQVVSLQGAAVRVIALFPSAAEGLPHSVAVANSKRTVYVLRMVQAPVRYYTGITSDVRARLAAHNAGRCGHTAYGRPWLLNVVIEVADERRGV